MCNGNPADTFWASPKMVVDRTGGQTVFWVPLTGRRYQLEDCASARFRASAAAGTKSPEDACTAKLIWSSKTPEKQRQALATHPSDPNG